MRVGDTSVGAGILLVTAAACGGHGMPPMARSSVRMAPGGIQVQSGQALQPVIDAAADGATLTLAPGRYPGPIVISRPLCLQGPADAVLYSASGSTVRVEGRGVVLRGVTVAGSGQRFDLMDGGIHLTGEGHLVEGVTVRDALFGILVEQCRDARILGNTVIGSGSPALGLRGDGIRLWETTDSVVAGNEVRDVRDLVVWYSSRNRLQRNRVAGSRYGTHFMYSHDCVVEDSRYVGNEVSVFVMYSHGVQIRRSLLARAGGSAGIGIGLKESGDIVVEDNWLLADTTGFYIDRSPMNPSHSARYARNVVRFAETAISLHAGIERTEFVDNDFRDNGAVIKVGGQGDGLGATFAGNHYDSYRGYDLNGDGRGDVPFEFRRLSTQLEGRYPELALLHGSPAMSMVDLVGEVMPLFAPRRLLTDPSPRMRSPTMSWVPEDDDGG